MTEYLAVALLMLLVPPPILIGSAFVVRTTRQYWTVAAVLMPVSVAGIVLLAVGACR